MVTAVAGGGGGDRLLTDDLPARTNQKSARPDAAALQMEVVSLGVLLPERPADELLAL